MTEDERLALLAALDKRVAPALREAKDEARASLLEAWEADGTDRRAIRVGGEKVGEVGISYSRPAAYVKAGRDAEALAALRELGLTEEVPAKGWEREYELVGGQVVHRGTGEVAGWAGWSPSTPRSASVRGCDPADVLRAFGPRVGASDVMGLLKEGGAR